MHALVERQLGVEVGVLAVAVSDVLAREHLDEHLDQVASSCVPETRLSSRIASKDEIGSRYESRAVITS